MIRRFLSGVFWGGVVSALGLGAVSQLAPLPVSRIAAEPTSVQLKTPAPIAPVVVDDAVVDPDADAVIVPPPIATEAEVEPTIEAAPEAFIADSDPAAQPATLDAEPAPAATAEQLDPPAGSEFAKPLPDSDPVLPAIETAPPIKTVDLAPLAPPASDAASKTDVPSVAPETGLEPPAPLMPLAESEVAVEPPVAVVPDQIALAEPVQPAVPQVDLAPLPVQDTVPPVATEPDEALLKPLPEILPLPKAKPAPDVEPVPVDDTSPQLEPDAPLVPERNDTVDGQAENSAKLAPTPRLEGQVDGVTTGRLPRIGDAAMPEDGDADSAADTEPTLTIEPEQDLPPLQKYARSFDNPDAKPLFSIILIDTGGTDLDRAALAALPFPVTFALDPLAADAAEASKIYRDAGQEVIMVATGIPSGATAADLEVTFEAHAAALPEAVAVIDTEFGSFQTDRPLATQVVPILQAQGRGLISWDRGLNSADQVARRQGLAATMVFRKLDGKGENTAAVRRALDRAAFKAAQDGTVTVIGQTIPETVAALLEWAVEGRAASVALAPVSAVLMK